MGAPDDNDRYFQGHQWHQFFHDLGERTGVSAHPSDSTDPLEPTGTRLLLPYGDTAAHDIVGSTGDITHPRASLSQHGSLRDSTFSLQMPSGRGGDTHIGLLDMGLMPGDRPFMAFHTPHGSLFSGMDERQLDIMARTRGLDQSGFNDLTPMLTGTHDYTSPGHFGKAMEGVNMLIGAHAHGDGAKIDPQTDAINKTMMMVGKLRSQNGRLHAGRINYGMEDGTSMSYPRGYDFHTGEDVDLPDYD